MSDIYEAPSAELREDESGSEFGSLEQGIAGDYDLSIGGIFEDGRSLLNGNKGTIWIGALLFALASIAIQFGSAFVIGILPMPATLSAAMVQVVITLLTTPISVGFTLLGVKLAAGRKASGTSIFNYFGMMIKLFLLTLLMYLLIAAGFLLLILPGIYLSIAYVFAALLVVDKDLGIWEALEASRKAVTHKWFTVFGYMIIMVIVLIVSALPLLIGLIWTLPLAVLCFGVVYKTVFGVERQTLDSE